MGTGTLRTFRVPVRFDELVVLAPSFHVKPLLALQPSLLSQGRERGHGSAVRAAAGAIGIGSMIGAAITNHRTLGPAGARFTAAAGLIVLLVAVLAVLWPRVVVLPLATVGVWVATALFVRAFGMASSPGRSKIQPQQAPCGPDPAAGGSAHAEETS